MHLHNINKGHLVNTADDFRIEKICSDLISAVKNKLMEKQFAHKCCVSHNNDPSFVWIFTLPLVDALHSQHDCNSF